MTTVDIDGQKLLDFANKLEMLRAELLAMKQINRTDILVKALQEIAETSEEWEERNAVTIPWWLLGNKARRALNEFSGGNNVSE